MVKHTHTLAYTGTEEERFHTGAKKQGMPSPFIPPDCMIGDARCAAKSFQKLCYPAVNNCTVNNWIRLRRSHPQKIPAKAKWATGMIHT